MKNDLFKKTEELLYKYPKLIDKAWQLSDMYGDDDARVKEIDNQLILLNNAIDDIMYDKYYETVELYYFHKMKQKDIVKKMKTTNKTISTNRKRLVDELSKIIFQSEYITNMFLEVREQMIKTQ